MEICKGSIKLGTGCGECEECKEELKNGVTAMVEDIDNSLVVVPEDAPNLPVDNSAFSVMERALRGGITLAQVEKMMDIQERQEGRESKKAFISAMALFKKEPIVITKDKKNNAFQNARYTSIGNLVNTVLPVMSKYGLSHNWDIKQEGENIKVICIVTHEQGYSKQIEMIAPPDNSGGKSKNHIQQIKSTTTYLKSATFESIMGLASSDANINDDGNGASESQLPDEIERDLSVMENAKDITAYFNANKQKYGKYFKLFTIACEDRKKELKDA